MPFWRFFGRHVDDAILRSPLDRIASNSCSWAHAGHFTGIWRWKGENTSISRLPLFCPGATLPLDGIAPNSGSWAFACHSTRIKRWKRENTSISRLHLFCSLEQLLAVFRPSPRRCCPALTLGMNCTKLGSLGFCRPFHRNLALETRKYQY